VVAGVADAAFSEDTGGAAAEVPIADFLRDGLSGGQLPGTFAADGLETLPHRVTPDGGSSSAEPPAERLTPGDHTPHSEQTLVDEASRTLLAGDGDEASRTLLTGDGAEPLPGRSADDAPESLVQTLPPADPETGLPVSPPPGSQP
jgi:hypothetical protein